MGRAPCCEKVGLKRGPWSTEEDQILINFIKQNGHSNWRALPKKAGLLRCGKSCRLRWTNYLRPDIKRGDFTHEEEDTILNLHQLLGNRWAAIAAKLPGRTDNEIKNVWHTHLKKRLINQNPQTKLKKNTGSRSQPEPPCSVARSDGAEDVDGIQQPSCEGEENTDSSQPSSCEGEENTDSSRPPPPCSVGRSDDEENVDSSVKNNNDDDTMLVELAFAKDFLKNLWSEEESFENEWNLERYCERRNSDQATQEVQIPSSGEAISSCSSSDSRDDIIDFWSSILMRDGELSELQEI